MKLEKKYLCIFCGKRKSTASSFYNNGRTGLCADCFSKLRFTPHPPLFANVKYVDYVVSPLFYEGKIREVILDLKFNSHYAAADTLSHLLCDLLNNMTVFADFDCVVPVPLSKKRLNERGFNQSELLAKPFAKYFGIEYRDDILVKTRETQRQSRLAPSERLTNVKDAFFACNDAKDKRILLIDDIMTTGSTLTACAKALKTAGAKNIVGVTLTKREIKENIFNRMY